MFLNALFCPANCPRFVSEMKQRAIFQIVDDYLLEITQRFCYWSFTWSESKSVYKYTENLWYISAPYGGKYLKRAWCSLMGVVPAHWFWHACRAAICSVCTSLFQYFAFFPQTWTCCMKSPQRMLNGKRPLQTAVLINHYNLLAKDETCLCDMRRPAGSRAPVR